MRDCRSSLGNGCNVKHVECRLCAPSLPLASVMFLSKVEGAVLFHMGSVPCIGYSYGVDQFLLSISTWTPHCTCIPWPNMAKYSALRRCYRWVWLGGHPAGRGACGQKPNMVCIPEIPAVLSSSAFSWVHCVSQR